MSIRTDVRRFVVVALVLFAIHAAMSLASFFVWARNSEGMLHLSVRIFMLLFGWTMIPVFIAARLGLIPGGLPERFTPLLFIASSAVQACLAAAVIVLVWRLVERYRRRRERGESVGVREGE